ncbi:MULTISPECIES: EndoU domain-containing protein [Actinosynnema]|uniref:EndoU domain-containing protein n=1 Tax=Actinosynnema TaxID=40566 RepID=UPI0020A3233C|nr:EndoU domain-containing protein [Actinosynnema pretiosum]MCP2098665.1 hypothetical protein [Actinosynnema pretiosum]
MNTAIRTRPVILAVALATAFLLVLGLVAPPTAVPGSASTVDAERLSGEVLRGLAEAPELHLVGDLRTASGAPLELDVAVLADGRLSAIVDDDAGGTAEFAVVGDRAVVRANRAWWVNTLPAAADTSADRWVQADDNSGFPVGMLGALSGTALGALVAQRTEDSGWRITADELDDGTPVSSLTTNDGVWTVQATLDDPPRLVGLRGPLAAGVRKFAGGTRATTYSDVSLRTERPDSGCRERAEKELAEAAPDIEAAPPPPQPVAPQDVPSVAVTIVSTGVCMTPVCPTPVTVTNTGKVQVAGSLMVSSSSGGGGVFPVALPPGGSATSTAVVTNPASTCTRTCTVPYQVSAFVQVQSAGVDLDRGKRLHDRGIDPNDPIPGNGKAKGPDVLAAIDGLVKGLVAPPGFGRTDPVAAQNAVVLGTIEAYLGNALLHKARQVLDSNALVPTTDVNQHPLVVLAAQFDASAPNDVDGAEAARKTFLLLHRLATEQNRQPGTLTVHNGALVDRQTARAYSVAGLSPGDKPGGRHSLGSSVDRAERALTTALSRFPEDTTNVLVLHADQTAEVIGPANRSAALRFLEDPKLFPLVTDPAVTELIITNDRSKVLGDPRYPEAYVFDGADLAALRATFDPSARPATPPANPTLNPVNRRHVTTGDPFDPTTPESKQDSGGHSAGAGVADKTEFPIGWSDADVEQAVLAVIAAPASPPTSRPAGNHMGRQQWGWVYRGKATVNGITVELEVIVLEDGQIRTAYPTETPDPSKPEWDPTVVFRNPAKAPDTPQDIDLGDGPRSNFTPLNRPRYVRARSASEPGYWEHHAITRPSKKQAKAGQQAKEIKVRTGPDGRFDRAVDVYDAQNNRVPVQAPARQSPAQPSPAQPSAKATPPPAVGTC